MKQPNLLVIMSDEHQARAMSCTGHFVSTPNLDALASRGVRFTNAYTPSPICVPARASFATGRYVHQIRLWDNSMPYHGQIPGWGHGLQAKGIPVESIGKLHYRSKEDPAGFDVEHVPMMVVNGTGMVFASIRKEDERITPAGRMLGEYIGPGESKYTKYDRAVVKTTEQWFEDRKGDDRPWCLFVGLVAPHFPLVCPQQFYEMYPANNLPEVKLHPNQGYIRHPWVEKQNAFNNSEQKFNGPEERMAAMSAYYGLTSWLDYNVGRILNALSASGMNDNTTVVYTSDHGDNVGARGLWGKSNMYEESVSIPLIMAGPNITPEICDTPVSLLDLSQTILHHFDAQLISDGPGQSLYEIPNYSKSTEREIFSEYHAIGAVSGAFMLRSGRWKLIHYVDFEPELFDLEADPEELNNLAGNPEFSEFLSRLSVRLEKLCDTRATDMQAHADQAALVEAFGGKEKAIRETVITGGTPPPESAIS